METEGFLLHPRLGRVAQTGSKTDTEELKMAASLQDTSICSEIRYADMLSMYMKITRILVHFDTMELHTIT